MDAPEILLAISFNFMFLALDFTFKCVNELAPDIFLTRNLEEYSSYVITVLDASSRDCHTNC
jgi:hypothetical protein